MEERRIFLDSHDLSDIFPGESITLPDKERHYLSNVLRLQDGDNFVIVNRDGGRTLKATLADGGSRAQIQELVEHLELRSRIRTLAFALTKGDHNELVCEKACEIGLEQLIFWQADHSVVRVDSEKTKANKLERFKRIAEAACRQSKKSAVPQVQLCVGIEGVLDTLNTGRSDGERMFTCSLAAEAREFRLLAGTPATASLVVGPEGDFSEREAGLMTSAGFESLSLGPARLRSETAALVAMSVICGVWGYR